MRTPVRPVAPFAAGAEYLPVVVVVAVEAVAIVGIDLQLWTRNERLIPDAGAEVKTK